MAWTVLQHVILHRFFRPILDNMNHYYLDQQVPSVGIYNPIFVNSVLRLCIKCCGFVPTDSIQNLEHKTHSASHSQRKVRAIVCSPCGRAFANSSPAGKLSMAPFSGDCLRNKVTAVWVPSMLSTLIPIDHRTNRKGIGFPTGDLWKQVFKDN